MIPTFAMIVCACRFIVSAKSCEAAAAAYADHRAFNPASGCDVRLSYDHKRLDVVKALVQKIMMN